MGAYCRSLALVAVLLASLPFPCEGDCSSWLQYGGRFYDIRKTKVGWNTAKEECENDGGTLAMLKTKGLHDYLVGTLRARQIPTVWIGLKYTKSQNNNNNIDVRRRDWEWNDGSELDQGDFQKWKKTEPGKSNYKKCAMLYALRINGVWRSVHEWYATQCARSEFYICEREHNPCHPFPVCEAASCHGGCPGGSHWYEYLGVYYYVKTHTHTYTYLVAKNKCTDLASGAKLATSNSQDVNAKLAGLLAQKNIHHAFLGLHYSKPVQNSDQVDQRRNDWKWQDGALVRPDVFHNWTTNQPHKQQKCTRLEKKGSGPYQWYGTMCNMGSNYICMRGTSPCVSAYDDRGAHAQSSSTTPAASVPILGVFTLTSLLVCSIQRTM